ncbi:LicD family protein [Pseudomonas promysalinigenes]
MLDSPQLDLDSCLKIFPNLRYIGGSVGHRLDIHASCVQSQTIKISLSGHGILALEQVVIYGRAHPEGELRDITKLEGCRVFQSTTRQVSHDATQDSEALYGAYNAINGIVDGYNRSETEAVDQPYWRIEFPEDYLIETIHITNFSSAGYAVRYSDIVIESAYNDTVSMIYRRSAPHVLRAKLNSVYQSLSNFRKLKPLNTKQRQAQDFLETSHRLLIENPDCIDHVSFSEQLLNCIEVFLPRSLEPRGRSYQFRDISDVSQIRITGINCDTITPKILAEYYDPVEQRLSSVEFESKEAFFSHPRYIVSLSIYFGCEDSIYKANCFRVEASNEPHASSAECEWDLIYDNAHVADLCKDLAWVAFLAGNETARCLGLIAKPAVMMRRSDKELKEAYFWCRLNLHGKSSDVQSEVASIVNSATAYDTQSSRLRFGRHSFSTCLGDRNQAQYVAAILDTFSCLEKNSIPAMLLYGTLLGAVRSGTFIKHDDDVDIGYLSQAFSHEQLVAEREKLREIFESSNFRVSAASSHLPFSVSPMNQEEPCWVEIFPVWSDKDDTHHYKIYMHTMNVHSVDKNIIGCASTFQKVCLNGTAFPAPAQPEKFLEVRYGENWRSPDPFFEI